jgi:hypothetical protein
MVLDEPDEGAATSSAARPKPQKTEPQGGEGTTTKPTSDVLEIVKSMQVDILGARRTRELMWVLMAVGAVAIIGGFIAWTVSETLTSTIATISIEIPGDGHTVTCSASRSAIRAGGQASARQVALPSLCSSPLAD